ncbi:MAG TPA: methyl-accepting chemotaxis protein [Geobacterales bacterium]|nr:methyl-accepting chemotaxis protein [Geobacterales bacterium]
MKLADLRVGQKLYLGLGTVVAIFFFFAIFQIWNLNHLGKLQDEGAKRAEDATIIGEAQVTVGKVYTVMADAEINRNLSQSRRDFAEVKDEMLKDLQTVTELADTPEERAAAERLSPLIKVYLALFEDRLLPLLEKGMTTESTELRAVDAEIDKVRQEAIGTLEVIVKSLRHESIAGDQEFDGQRRLGTVLTIVISLVLILISLAIAYYMSRSITVPLSQAVAVAEQVASGDLTSDIEVTSHDETGQLLLALKKMNDGLEAMVSEVRESSDAIASATQQIATGNSDLSQRTEEQASALEETASSMEELTSTVHQNKENAQHANQLALSANEVAAKGGEVIRRVVTTMQSISDSSKRIVDIISVIDGIAFQTNILALNAAVEAARAGQQGRGFAVVAGEVRNLAQRSAAAAKEIKGLISDSVNKVEEGTREVNHAGATIEELITSVKRVTDIMAEITAASVEQSSGIEQVNTAITQMDQVTQQNAALVEEAASAAEAMEDQAQSLVQLMSRFKVAEDNEGRQKHQEKERKPVAKAAGHPVVAKNDQSRHAASQAKSAKPSRTAVLVTAATEDRWEKF